jgi:hypothetical protein
MITTGLFLLQKESVQSDLSWISHRGEGLETFRVVKVLVIQNCFQSSGIAVRSLPIQLFVKDSSYLE